MVHPTEMDGRRVNLDYSQDRLLAAILEAWAMHDELGVSPAQRIGDEAVDALFSLLGFFWWRAKQTGPEESDVEMWISRRRPMSTPRLYRAAGHSNRLGWSWTPSFNEARAYAWRRDCAVYVRPSPSPWDVLAIWEAPFGPMLRTRWYDRVPHGSEWIVRPRDEEITLFTTDLEIPEPDPLEPWLRRWIGKPWVPPAEEHIPRWGIDPLPHVNSRPTQPT